METKQTKPRPRRLKYTFKSDSSIRRLDDICKLLQDNGEMSVSQIEAVMDAPKHSIYYFVNKLCKTGRIHLSDFKLTKDKDSTNIYHKSKAAFFKIGKKEEKDASTASYFDYVNSNDDRKIVITRATDVPFIKNTDPLMVALYGMQ